MSESGYQELDLDALDKPKGSEVDDIVLVEEEDSVPEQEPEAPPAPAAKPTAQAEDDDDEGAEAPTDGARRPLTRTQRLKAARDHWKQTATKQAEELEQVKQRLAKIEGDAIEGAAVSMDLYIRSLDDKMKALRADYDKAFDAGDRDALFKVTQEIAEVQAEKKSAERERRTIPTKAAPTTGTEGSQPPQTTTATTRQPSSPASGSPAPQQASPEALAWYNENKDWFGKDKRATALAYAIDAEMVEDGYDARQEGYYDELNKRLAEAMPDKFGRKQQPSNQPPTIQNRGAVANGSGKVTVRVTAADRQMADTLGIDIRDYMREKIRREQAAKSNTNGYTEIV